MACAIQPIIHYPLRSAAAIAVPRAGLRSVFESCQAMLRTWPARIGQGHALNDLDDRLLDDIGVTRVAAQRECAKLFWRPFADN